MASLALGVWYNFSDYSSAEVAMNGGGVGFGGWVTMSFRHPTHPAIADSTFTFNSETNGTQGDDAILRWSKASGKVVGLSGATSARWSADIPWFGTSGVKFSVNGGGGFGTGASGVSSLQTVTFTIPKVTVTYVDDSGAVVTEQWEIYDTIFFRGPDETPPYESDTVTLQATSDSGLTQFVYTVSDSSVAVVNGDQLKMIKYADVTITATQPGDSTYNATSASVTISPPALPAAQTITFSVPAYMTVGQYAEFTYSASSGLPVTVFSVSPEIVEITPDGRLHALLPGGSALVFNQNGNADWADATAQAIVVVDGLPQTITFPPLPSDLKVGDSVALSATSSAGLSISFSSSAPGVASVSGTTLTINSQGLTEITATAQTSAVYNPASAKQQVVVGQSGQSLYFPALPSASYGVGEVAINASATSGLPLTTTSSNSAVASVIGATLRITGVGTTTITVSQPGNGYWLAAAPQQQLLTVVKGDPGLQFTSPGESLSLGERKSLSASASNGQPVTFFTTGSLTVETVDNVPYVVANTIGSGTITALVNSTALYNSGAITYQVLAGKLSQSIDFSPLGIFSFTDFPFALGGTASSGLPVSYTTNNSNVATVVGGRLTITGVGVALVTATQAGDSIFNAAPSVTRQIAVEKAGQAIAFQDLSPVAYKGQTFSLQATAPGGAVEFRSSNPSVATVNGDQIVINGLGVSRIIATQAGNEKFLPAIAVQSVIVLPTIPSVQATRGALDSEAHNSLVASAQTSGGAVLVQPPAVLDRETFSSTEPSVALSCGGAQISISTLDVEQHSSGAVSNNFSGAAFNMSGVPQGTDESIYSAATMSVNYSGVTQALVGGLELDLAEYRSWLASAATGVAPVAAKYSGSNEFELYFAPTAYEPIGFLKWANGNASGAIQQFRVNEDNATIKGKVTL